MARFASRDTAEPAGIIAAMEKTMTRREARRRLGSRTRRRANTGGKIISGGSGKKRSQCRRYPNPAKRLVAVAVERLVRS